MEVHPRMATKKKLLTGEESIRKSIAVSQPFVMLPFRPTWSLGGRCEPTRCLVLRQRCHVVFWVFGCGSSMLEPPLALFAFVSFSPSKLLCFRCFFGIIQTHPSVSVSSVTGQGELLPLTSTRNREGATLMERSEL